MENVTYTRDVTDWSKSTQNKAYIAFLDFEKAFDMANWRYRDEVLRALGVPERYIAMLRSLYNDASVKLIVNGKLSSVITQGRGVRQGCPLSPFIFALLVEPLGELLRSHAAELGICLPKIADDNSDAPLFMLVSQFADDTTIYCRHPALMLRALQLTGAN